MKCHFVYAIPFTERMVGGRIWRKIIGLLIKGGLLKNLLKTRKPSSNEMERWPARHPATVAKHLYCALEIKMETLLYHITERCQINLDSDDVFIGHPYFPHGGIGVTELTNLAGARPKIFSLIVPLHCDVKATGNHIGKEFLDDIEILLPKVDIIFAIMGEYWWDKWDSSPYAHWKPKMIRLDMAVDGIVDFPRVKKSFNKKGRRGFLYIGVNEPRKGTDFLSELMSYFPDCPRGWIGPGKEIPNVTRISGDRPLTRDFMSSLAEDYDFFISPSRVDPNPTTILQSMAWGFPVISTLESGYYKSTFRKIIHLDDMQKSIAILNELQNADESELLEMADEARNVVLKDYNWEKFTTTVIDELGV